MATQLQFAELAREVGAVIEQPCKTVHDPCCGAKRFTTDLHVGKICSRIVIRSQERAPVLTLAESIEHCTCFFRQHKRLCV
ncbi:hypothetical protein AQZ52_03225 [Novosphingobium fuchskuhlense]|uniref:Uncharacterized protein n=1 Tax=Novosphingobium fuchskuhlense TaxID=1117702 RepID=A0A117UWS2_9SPHN|nr:hypothetical protein AQZ52_03225 [Novosphingobium fuchskuhlense]